MAYRVKSKSAIMQEKKEYDRKREAEKDLDNLFVFGYSCKLFRDAENAEAVNSGSTLVPWQGDDSLMIDRFDGRGHLWDLKPFDSANVKPSQQLIEEERYMEELCDEERYLELHTDVREKAIYEEEDIKRLTTELQRSDDPDRHNAVPFSYDARARALNTQPASFEDPDPYDVPEELTVPDGMKTPSGAKLGAIIERTAGFVGKKGAQMEILLKTKQANNPQFAFLHYDHELHPFYQHVVTRVRYGVFDPATSQAKQRTSTESDDHYLHPSLASSSPKPDPEEDEEKPLVLPTLNKDQLHSTAYGKLIKKLAPIVPKPKPPPKVEPPPEEVKQEPDSLPPYMATSTFGPQLPTESDLEKMREAEKAKEVIVKEEKVEQPPAVEVSRPMVHGPNIHPPAPDLQIVIDKMAEYVAKNGDEFEQAVRAKGDPRFAFLQSDNQHFAYYSYKKHLCSTSIEEKPKTVVNTKAGLKFSIKRPEQQTSKSLQPSLKQAGAPAQASVSRSAWSQAAVSQVSSQAVKSSSSPSQSTELTDQSTTQQRKQTMLVDYDSDKDVSTTNDTEASELVCHSDTDLTSNKSKSRGMRHVASTADMGKKLAESTLRDRLAAAARHRLSREQMERKKRAEKFLSERVSSDVESNGSAPESPRVTAVSTPPPVEVADDPRSDAESSQSSSSSDSSSDNESVKSVQKPDPSPVADSPVPSPAAPSAHKRQASTSPSPSPKRKRRRSSSKRRKQEKKKKKKKQKTRRSRSRSPRSKSKKKRSHSFDDDEKRHKSKKSKKHKHKHHKKHKKHKHRIQSPPPGRRQTLLPPSALASVPALASGPRRSESPVPVLIKTVKPPVELEEGELNTPEREVPDTEAPDTTSPPTTNGSNPTEKPADQRLVDRVREMLRKSRQMPLS